ncbi:MAG: LLM class F420-dependent oxidoreductase [Caldilineaceae bacterium]|nr:LLM class F420-dependent oxidoreductase [Caldilineaceae bacterium]
MKFGVFLPSHGPAKSPHAVHQVAQAAEQAGYDSLWAADHVLVHQRFSDFCLIETFVTLGYVAAITEKITLGTTVLVLPQRDPILAAKQAAAVDQYSGGRLILGIGVGWMEDEYRYLRTDFSKRGRMMDEWMDVMRVLWREDEPTFQGEWISFEESAFEPKPAQKGGPPYTIGGLSDAAIRRAATKASGWHPIQIEPEEVAAGVAKMRAWANGEPRTVIFHARTELGDQADPEVSILRGSMSEISDRIGRYAEAGVEHMLFDFNTTPTAGAIQDQMERIASDVFPVHKTA